MRTLSFFLCMRTHTGDWVQRQQVNTTFLTREKLSQLFLVLLTGLGLGSLMSQNLEFDALPIDLHPGQRTLYPLTQMATKSTMYSVLTQHIITSD